MTRGCATPEAPCGLILGDMGARPHSRDSARSSRSYPRKARLSALLREVVAEELEKVTDLDESLGLLTVTAVEADADLGNATVYLASMSEQVAEQLETHRGRLQGAIARQVRLKRTPHLRFKADPAIESGLRIEQVLHEINQQPQINQQPGAGV